MLPMLATRGPVLPGGAARVPTGGEWWHEVKWDGMRVLVQAGSGAVNAFSRRENDVSVSFPELAPLGEIGGDVLLDGELVVIGQDGPSFAALADRMHVTSPRRAATLAQTTPVTMIAFDLLRADGVELLGRPLAERRERLVTLDLPAPVQVPPTYDDGQDLLEAVAQQGLEGILSKRRGSAYHPGRRSRDWLKFPLRPTSSFVVGGLRRERGQEVGGAELSSGGRLGALLVGVPGASGLEFRGRVGSGVAGRAAERLAQLLLPLVSGASPFDEDLPRADRVGTTWVRPEVVVDVEYLVLTRDGRLRQPAYRGVRTDLTPSDLHED